MADETWWQAFSDCLGAVMGHWYALIPGVALSIVDIIERIRGNEVSIPLRWLFRIFIVGFVVAQFMAYWDLRKEIISSHPDLRPHLDGVGVAPSGPANADCLITILALIKNFGAPGTVADIQVKFKIGSQEYPVQWAHEPSEKSEATLDTEVAGRGAVLSGSQYLSILGQKAPIQTGYLYSRMDDGGDYRRHCGSGVAHWEQGNNYHYGHLWEYKIRHFYN
jgi:hypothetical protein